MALTKVTFSMIDGGIVYAKDYGADPTGSTDATTALQNACDAAAGKLLLLEPNATYKCSASIHMKGDVDGRGATLAFYSNSYINGLVYQNTQGSLRNFTIDGSNAVDVNRGLFVDTDFVQTATCYYDLTIKNITTNSTANQDASGALFYKASGASVNLDSDLDIRLVVDTVVANSNGVPGTNRGVAKGIIVAFNCTGTNSRVHVHDCKVVGVSSGGSDPAQDADGIHFTQADYQTAGAQGLFTIRDCSIEDCKKRGVKIQAVNATVDNVVVEATNTLAGFETYSDKTTFINCKCINGAGTTFTTSFTNTKFLNCYGESTANNWDVARVYSGANGAVFDDCKFVSTATYATGDFGLIRVYAADNVQISNTQLICTTNTGCSLLVRNAATIRIDNSYFEGGNSGINLWQSTGRVVMSDSEISAMSSCVSRAASTTQAFYARDSRFTSDSGTVIDLYNSGGANAAYCELDNCLIVVASGNGVFALDGSRVTNCRVDSSDTSGIGINMTGSGSVTRNCQISKFATGVNLSYTTNAELADNVTVGSTTGYVTTGYTVFVNYNNNSR